MDLPDNEQKLMQRVPQSNWYKFTLECGHAVYSRVRLKYEKPDRQRHRVRCPQCQEANTKASGPVPLTWSQVVNVQDVTDAEVSNVLSGTSFIVSRSILRFDISGHPNGNPFPYASQSRGY